MTTQHSAATNLGPTAAPVPPGASGHHAFLVWTVGGVCWLAAAAIHDDADPRFTIASVVWLTADALIAIGIVSLMRSRPHGPRRIGTAALTAALVARALFAAGEVHSLIRGDDHTTLLPIAAALTAVSMTCYGVVVWRARLVHGVARSAPLLMGLYPFVAMFPLVAMTDEPPVLTIAGWGLLTTLVALTARQAPGRPVAAPGRGGPL